MINITINGHKAQWDENKPLLTKGESNKKIAKSEKFKGGIYSTMILHLSPHSMSGFNVCPKASEGCKNICLNFSGQGGMFKSGKVHESMIHIARVGRTTLLMTKKALFFKKLKHELNGFLIKCEIKGSIPCIRLNGTSDINWGKLTDPETGKTLMELFPQINFYDYTKVFSYLKHNHKNYFLTFSKTEDNDLEVIKALNMGVNVAVVFDKKIGLPETYKGYPVFDADKTDLRFLDNELAGVKGGMIVGLVEKGYLAKRDKTGFVVRDHMAAVKAAA